MKAVVERVLGAEDDAKRIVADAEARAASQVQAAQADAERVMDAAARQAREHADSLLRDAQADADRETRQILDAAKARAAHIALLGETVDNAQIARLANEIAGLSP